MTTKATGNGMERWRGETTERLNGLSRQLEDVATRIERKIDDHAADDQRKFAAVDEARADDRKKLDKLVPKVAVANVKVAGLYALASALGAGATTYVLHRLIG